MKTLTIICFVQLLFIAFIAWVQFLTLGHIGLLSSVVELLLAGAPGIEG